VSADTLKDAFREPASKRAYVRALFATIADRYDLITRLLSYGRDGAWKRHLVSLSGARAGTRALDLATGTGDIAFLVAERGASVVGLDVTHRMLQLAHAKNAAPCRFVTGDMMALPFPSGSFDLVTTGYGIRNVPVIEPALAEIHRVLRPGGLLLSLDFNKPDNGVVRAIYLGYLTIVGSALGVVLHGDPDTYRYIPESIKRYPGANGVADLLRRAGFSRSIVHSRLGGLMAINEARRL
jgi:ubiquinone/menaquinone biosynthesis methyltransferase